jgi:hypothetical protein
VLQPFFGKGSFIFSFVSYGLVTNSLGAGCTFEEVAEKIKCQKMNVIVFYHQSRMIHVSRGQNPLKLLYSIMILNNDFQHNSPTLQGRANKYDMVATLCFLLES